MEIDITRIVTDEDPAEFSGSVATHGANVGAETWSAAVAHTADRPLVETEAGLTAIREWAAGFGAWDREEIAGWSPAECNALLLQYIAGDMGEARSLHPGDGPGGIDWDSYRAAQEEGQCSSMMSLGDDGRVYAYVE